jgi:hypothetical protein
MISDSEEVFVGRRRAGGGTETPVSVIMSMLPLPDSPPLALISELFFLNEYCSIGRRCGERV